MGPLSRLARDNGPKLHDINLNRAACKLLAAGRVAEVLRLLLPKDFL